MANTILAPTPAQIVATRTTDAYSFHRYGLKNWTGCADMLLRRGYNMIEAECILRSTITRWALDNIKTRRKATAADLAYTLDNQMGGPVRLADYVADTVCAIMAPEFEKMNSRDALRLAWSR